MPTASHLHPLGLGRGRENSEQYEKRNEREILFGKKVLVSRVIFFLTICTICFHTVSIKVKGVRQYAI